MGAVFLFPYIPIRTSSTEAGSCFQAPTECLTCNAIAVTAVSFAGAFLALLTTWLRARERATPAHMDELFHRLAWAGLEGAPG